MALINKEKKFIFFHLYKCAGTSMRELLNTHNVFCYEYQGVHSMPRDAKESMYINGASSVFDEYYKFTIIRNPFDWLLSTYFYILKYKDHESYNIIQGMTFHQFLEYYIYNMMENKGKECGSNKNVTLFDYVTDKDGNILMDYIGRYETINEDMKNILGRVGIKYTDLPVRNVGSNRLGAGYQEHYNSVSRALVEKHFEKDLQFFNYQF